MQSIEACNNLMSSATAPTSSAAMRNKPEMCRSPSSLIRPVRRVTNDMQRQAGATRQLEVWIINKVAYTNLLPVCCNGTAGSSSKRAQWVRSIGSYARLCAQLRVKVSWTTASMPTLVWSRLCSFHLRRLQTQYLLCRLLAQSALCFHTCVNAYILTITNTENQETLPWSYLNHSPCANVLTSPGHKTICRVSFA